MLVHKQAFHKETGVKIKEPEINQLDKQIQKGSFKNLLREVSKSWLCTQPLA